MHLYFSQSFKVSRLTSAMRVNYVAQLMPHDVITLLVYLSHFRFVRVKKATYGASIILYIMLFVFILCKLHTD